MLLDILGSRYGCRPSAILRGTMLDFHVDLGAYLAACEWYKDAASQPNAVD